MKDYTSNDSGWKIGDRVKAFDSSAWMLAGGDVGDNSIFRKPATIIRVYLEFEDKLPLTAREKPKWRAPRVLANIRWDHNGKESKGHFLYGFEKI